MYIEENEGRGESVILEEGDALSKIPKTHRHLLTASLRQVFRDPVEHFHSIAKRCPFPKMKRWLEKLLAKPDWELQLHQGDPPEFCDSGYAWRSKSVRGAMIDLPIRPSALRKHAFPQPLAEYYSLVDSVHWNGFGCAGGLSGANGQAALSEYRLQCHGADLDPSTASIWGWSPCGDMLIWTIEGRGGWVCHEDGHVHLLGTIEKTIDWVYAKLIAKESPEYEFGWR